MKKNLIFKILCAAIALATMLCPLGLLFASAEETTANEVEAESPKYAAIDLLNTDLSKYISLGQYENVEVTLNIKVTDEELYSYALSEGVYTEVKSRETKTGDLITVTYVGSINVEGVGKIPVRGGSSTETKKITLDANAEDDGTIEAMLANSDKLVGVKPGNTVEVSVKMPDDYKESAMAGKEIIFDVTVGAIIEYGYTDSYVNSKYGCATVEDYKLLIMKEKMKSFIELLTYDVYLRIAKFSTIYQYPEEHYNYYYNAEYTYYKSYYDSNSSYQTTYGSFEAFLTAVGTSVEQIEQSAKIRTEKDLVCMAIYKTGVLGTVSDSEYESRLAQIAADNGMTVADLELMYSGRYDIQNLIIVDFVYENLSKLSKLTTDYSEYEYLLKEEAADTTPQVTLPVDPNAGPAIDSNIILMIVIIVLGFVGCLVLVILSRKAKKPEEEEEYEEYDDDEEYDEDGESATENDEEPDTKEESGGEDDKE